jgi:hypothetical protein
MKRKIIAIVLILGLLFSMTVFPAQAATPADIEASIVSGLAWLATQQQGAGSWQFYDFGPNTETDVAATGIVVLKFEDRAKELGLDPFDTVNYEYAQNVIDGLNYIYSNATMDANGVHFFPGGYTDVYTTGIAMAAVAASNHPADVVVGGALNGMTYQQVLQGMMDWMAYAQNNFGDYNDGGWPYSPNGTSWWADNSVSGYATIGIGFAASAPPDGFGLTIPATVLTGLNTWVTTVQVNGGAYDGGSIYNPDPSWAGSLWVNTLKTGNLLYELALTGVPQADARVTRALAFIGTYWGNAGGEYDGGGWMGDYQAMFTMMKGLQAYGITDVPGHPNWFDEVSTYIVTNQDTAGFWHSTSGEITGSNTFSTACALLTLERAVPQIPPTIEEGRMTGGGSLLMGAGKNAMRVTHGFELHCDVTQGPNNLEVNWDKGNKFHMETLLTALCSDDPNITPNPPAAGFDTYTGTGTGRYNGVSGATIEFTFTDDGEPGKNDTAKILIKDAGGNVVLDVNGNLQNGNQQAHKK